MPGKTQPKEKARKKQRKSHCVAKAKLAHKAVCPTASGEEGLVVKLEAPRSVPCCLRHAQQGQECADFVCVSHSVGLRTECYAGLDGRVAFQWPYARCVVAGSRYDLVIVHLKRHLPTPADGV
jgi:hypothetical protein